MATPTAAVSQGAARFFRWWFGELSACLPARVRQALGRSRQRVVVEFTDSTATFTHGKGEAQRRLGDVSLAQNEAGELDGSDHRRAIAGLLQGAGLRSAEVVLRVPRDKALRRQVELPAAAAENLREVLGFEMDRHTPFKANEVYYDYYIRGNDARRKRLKVDLVVIPKDVVERVVGLARSWGLAADALEVTGGPRSSERTFNLLPPDAVRVRGNLGRRLTVALAVAAFALFLTALYVPLQQKQDVLASTEARLMAVRTDAAQVDAMKKQLNDMVDRSRFVVGRRQTLRTATEVLNEVTRLLPDHTWALKFGIRGETLTISGYSAKPSALIGLLDRSDMLSEVRFSSPVTMDQKVGLERFNLSANILERGTQ